MNLKLVTLAALSTFGLGAVSAQAQEVRTVSYGDLDLSSEAGIARLDSRIAAAVRAVCTNDDSSLRGKIAERGCRAEAAAGVVGQRDMAIAGKGQVLVLNTARSPRAGR